MRKKPLSIVPSVYTNSENAIAVPAELGVSMIGFSQIGGMGNEGTGKGGPVEVRVLPPFARKKAKDGAPRRLWLV